MQTELKDSTAIELGVDEIIESFGTETNQQKIREGFDAIQEYVTNSSDSNAIAEVMKKIYTSEDKNELVPSAFLISLGADRIVIGDDGIFMKGGRFKSNMWETIESLNDKQILQKVGWRIYEQWIYRSEYLDKENKNSTRLLQRLLNPDKSLKDLDFVIDLQKRIILDGHSLLAEAVESGTFEESNIKRVVTEMLHSVNDKFQIDSFSDEEFVKLISLYKLFKKEKIVGELNNLEKLLE